MYMAGPALSIRDNNNHESTTPSRFTIGTFNIRRLSPAKRGQLSKDLGRLHVDICCLLDTKSPRGCDARSGNCRLDVTTLRTRLRRRYSRPWYTIRQHRTAVTFWVRCNGNKQIHLFTCLRHHQTLSDV